MHTTIKLVVTEGSENDAYMYMYMSLFHLVIVCIHPQKWGFTHVTKWLKVIAILEGKAFVCILVSPHQTLKLPCVKGRGADVKEAPMSISSRSSHISRSSDEGLLILACG